MQGAHHAWNIQGHRGRGYLARQFCRSRKSCGRRSGTYRPTHALVRGRRTARQHRGRQGTGIPGHRENRLQDRAIKDLYSLAETCASCEARGDKFSYSNLGYHILATRRSVCVVSPGDDVYRSIPSRKMLFERLLRGTRCTRGDGNPRSAGADYIGALDSACLEGDSADTVQGARPAAARPARDAAPLIREEPLAKLPQEQLLAGTRVPA